MPAESPLQEMMDVVVRPVALRSRGGSRACVNKVDGLFSERVGLLIA